MTKTLRFAFAAPLALALAACGSGAEQSGEIQGDAIAAIPAPAGSEWRTTAVMTEEGGTLVGNPDAPLKLVEYGSLTCPTCARFSMEGGEPLLEYVDSGVVSFELRQFAVHGPLDLLLQRMTQCGPVEAVIPLSDQVWANYETIMQPIQANQAAFEAAMQRPISSPRAGSAKTRAASAWPMSARSRTWPITRSATAANSTSPAPRPSNSMATRSMPTPGAHWNPFSSVPAPGKSGTGGA